jgi:hypothetical protein
LTRTVRSSATSGAASTPIIIGEPAAVVNRFGIRGADGQAVQWFAAGSILVDDLIGSITLESDGKLTYTRPVLAPMDALGVELVYELKNAFGTSTAQATIAVKKSWSN